MTVQTANEADIQNCFRLILGRQMNPEEIKGHMLNVGSPLAGVVALYLNSPEFERRGLLKPTASEQPTISEYHGFKIATDPGDELIGRHIVAGSYEPEVEKLVRQYLKPRMTFLDVGANVGLFSLMAADIVGESGFVIAIEPSPSNVRMLEISRVLNAFNNIEIHAVAADEKMRLLSYSTAYSNGTTNEPTSDVDRLIGSTMVPSMPIDIIVGGRHVDFLKIDVEGFEPIAMRGAAGTLFRDKPTIISEFAPTVIKGGADKYLWFLEELGYEIGVICPDGTVEALGENTETIVRISLERQVDHVDLFATARADHARVPTAS